MVPDTSLTPNAEAPLNSWETRTYPRWRRAAFCCWSRRSISRDTPLLAADGARAAFLGRECERSMFLPMAGQSTARRPRSKIHGYRSRSICNPERLAAARTTADNLKPRANENNQDESSDERDKNEELLDARAPPSPTVISLQRPIRPAHGPDGAMDCSHG